MKGSVAFKYDRVNDIVIAVPHWNIQTREDVLVWYSQYESYLKTFNRKMDIVAVLDDFAIGPAIGVVWGEYRALLHKNFTRINFRVHMNSRVKLFTNTSGVRYNVSTQEAASIEDAIEGIKAARVGAA